MMFILEFFLRKGNFPDNNFEIDESYLRYSFYVGDISFLQGNEKLVIEDLPLFDFVLSLDYSLKRLLEGLTEESIEFTESDEKIILNRLGGLIKITFSFSEKSFFVKVQEFINAFKTLANNLILKIEESYPEIKANEYYKKYKNQLYF